jgi:metallo-beta-lactamase family protein
MGEQLRLTFVTGVGTVTGANFLLETAGTKILIDCGMVQGERVAEQTNREAFPYDTGSITALIVTHAHLDHVGRIPKLVKDGFNGAIYSTPETRALAELVLDDAVGILANEAKEDGLTPIYDASDVARVFPLWKTFPYHEAFKISDDISIFLKDAGHILGSSMIEATIKVGDNTVKTGANIDSDARDFTAEKSLFASASRVRGASSSMSAPVFTKILFTGDLGNSPAPLLRDTEPVGDVDYLVMESVYGDRNHEPREERLPQFEKVIKDTLARGGTLVIPAFSVDRSQILLYELNNLVRDKRIPSVPVFFDSPLAEKVTAVYKNSTDLFNDAAKKQIASGDDIFSFPHLQFVETGEQSRGIDRFKGAKIILAGSGMSVGGRVISHEAHFLPDSKSTILLVGYQAAGSLGRELADGAKKVRIHGEDVKVNAKIETLYGYSAHKDGDHLVEFVSTATNKLKQIFVAMGEPSASMHLAQRLNDELQVKAIVPERLKEYPILP